MCIWIIVFTLEVMFKINTLENLIIVYFMYFIYVYVCVIHTRYIQNLEVSMIFFSFFEINYDFYSEGIQ